MANPDVFKGCISFHIPAADFSSSLQQSPLWQLGSVGLSEKTKGDEDEEETFPDRPEDVLLKTKLLTTPGNTDADNASQVLKAWASSDPGMKEVSPTE